MSEKKTAFNCRPADLCFTLQSQCPLLTPQMGSFFCRAFEMCRPGSSAIVPRIVLGHIPWKLCTR